MSGREEFFIDGLTVKYRGQAKTISYQDVTHLSQNLLWLILHTKNEKLFISKQLPRYKILYELLEDRLPFLVQAIKEKIESPLPLVVHGKPSFLILVVLLTGLFFLLGVGAAAVIPDARGGDVLGLLLFSLCLFGVAGFFLFWLVLEFPLSYTFESKRIVWQRPFRHLEFAPQQIKEAWLHRQVINTRGTENELLTLYVQFENDQLLTLQQNHLAYPLPQLLDALAFHYNLLIQRNRIHENIPYKQFARGSQREFSWYFTGQSGVATNTLNDIFDWLRGCEYVADRDLFNYEDHWQHPTDFEKMRRGDCEDHALWAWWKIAGLGLRAEFIVGTYRDHNNVDISHAWVVYEVDNRYYLLEATEKGKLMAFSLESKQTKYFPRYGVDHNFRTYRYKTAVTS